MPTSPSLPISPGPHVPCHSNLSHNQLSGAIPPSIGALTSLTSLDLSNNQLSGDIPPTISTLTSLRIL
ncbi:unnamed protein product [Closterium sp. NIES-54]